MVSKRAYRHGWVQKRADLGREIREKEIDNRQKDRKTVQASVSFILTDIALALKEGRLGLNIQDGEGFLNPLYKRTWDKALDDHYKDAVMGKPDPPLPSADIPQTTIDILADIRIRIGK